MAHIPGAQNTAADYSSRLETDAKDKLFVKIREDVQTLPIEINVQSAGVSQEEQTFYTNDDDETEEQYCARKKAIRKNHRRTYRYHTNSFYQPSQTTT